MRNESSLPPEEEIRALRQALTAERDERNHLEEWRDHLIDKWEKEKARADALEERSAKMSAAISAAEEVLEEAGRPEGEFLATGITAILTLLAAEKARADAAEAACAEMRGVCRRLMAGR